MAILLINISTWLFNLSDDLRITLRIYNVNIHTYIIGYYNPSVRIIDLVSHTTYVVCVNFVHTWRDLQFKVDSERQIFFEKLFMAILFTLRVFARNLLRGNRRRNIFRISFWCLAWDSNPGLSSNKPTHYLLDHGDFMLIYIIILIFHYDFAIQFPIFKINLMCESTCLFNLSSDLRITSHIPSI